MPFIFKYFSVKFRHLFVLWHLLHNNENYLADDDRDNGYVVEDLAEDGGSAGWDGHHHLFPVVCR